MPAGRAIAMAKGNGNGKTEGGGRGRAAAAATVMLSRSMRWSLLPCVVSQEEEEKEAGFEEEERRYTPFYRQNFEAGGAEKVSDGWLLTPTT